MQGNKIRTIEATGAREAPINIVFLVVMFTSRSVSRSVFCDGSFKYLHVMIHFLFSIL